MSTGRLSSKILVLLGLALAAPRIAGAACSVVAADKDGNGTTDLRIIGSVYKQNAIIEIKNVGYTVKIDCNGNGVYTDLGDITATSTTATIETYSLELAGGDIININQTENLSGAHKNIAIVVGGAGTKTTFTSGTFSIADSSLDIEEVGGAANDGMVVDFTGATVDNSRILVRADQGNGGDGVKWYSPASTNNSLVDLRYNLGYGPSFSLISDNGGVMTNSTLKAYVVGDDTSTYIDNSVTSFSGQVDSNSRVLYDAYLDAGNDRFTGHFDLAKFKIDPTGSGSEVYFNVEGGIGGDLLAVTDDATVGAATINGLLQIRLDGGPQPDNLNLALRGLTGSGKLRFWGDGENAARDQIYVTLVTDIASTNDLDIYAGGGPEDDLGGVYGDLISFSVTNNGAATFGPGGVVILDGGLEAIDKCVWTGVNAPHLAMNCEAGTF